MFDARALRLHAWHLNAATGQYVSVAVPRNRDHSPVLDLDFAVEVDRLVLFSHRSPVRTHRDWAGRLQGLLDEVTARRAEENRLLEEARREAALESQRAAAEFQRAAAESQRAAAESQRAEGEAKARQAAEARIAELLARLAALEGDPRPEA